MRSRTRCGTFLLDHTRTTGIYTLSLHDALPISTLAPSPSASSTDHSVTRAGSGDTADIAPRSEEHTSELQSPYELVCRLLLEKQEGNVDAVEQRGEPVDHAGQSVDDGRELLQHPPGVQGAGVVHDRLEAQHAFAFGVALQRQQPEVDLEDGEVPPRSLDHDCLSR